MTKKFVSAEELLDDKGFREYYLKRDSMEAKEFEIWLLSSPHYKTIVNEAIGLLDSFYFQDESISQVQIMTAKEKLFGAIEKIEADTIPVITMKRNRLRFFGAAAAAVILFVSLGTWFWMYNNKQPGFNTLYGQVKDSNLPDGSSEIGRAHV